MSVQAWKITAMVFLALGIVLVLLAIVLYRTLRIHQVREVLTGRSEAIEIERMRSARAGTWSMDEQSLFSSVNFNSPSTYEQSGYGSTGPSQGVVPGSADDSTAGNTVRPAARLDGVDDAGRHDEEATSLMAAHRQEDEDDESKTTLVGRS